MSTRTFDSVHQNLFFCHTCAELDPISGLISVSVNIVSVAAIKITERQPQGDFMDNVWTLLYVKIRL